LQRTFSERKFVAMRPRRHKCGELIQHRQLRHQRRNPPMGKLIGRRLSATIYVLAEAGRNLSTATTEK
jgi:hypothetical protein